MINSPGGIQAGRDVILRADRHLIRSIEVRMSVETGTSPTTPQDPGVDAGLRSFIALFTRDKMRIRFASNWELTDHQFSATRRRLSFVYVPENPAEILGREIAFLGTIDVLALNYSEIMKTVHFSTGSNTQITALITVNGIPIAELWVGVEPGLLDAGQVNWSVTEAFAQIPRRYEAMVSR